jgi:hypothetical protein
MIHRLQFPATRIRLLPILGLGFICALACATQLSSSTQLAVNNPRPNVSSFSPMSVVAGSPSITLYISGNDFATGATVGFGGTLIMPRDINGAQITVDIPSSALVQAGTRIVSVTNPPPGGGTAQALMPFQVIAPPPRPQN